MLIFFKVPLQLSFEPCFQTPEKCGFINASVSLDMLTQSEYQGEQILIQILDYILYKIMLINLNPTEIMKIYFIFFIKSRLWRTAKEKKCASIDGGSKLLCCSRFEYARITTEPRSWHVYVLFADAVN